jgi:hypothetical protein
MRSPRIAVVVVSALFLVSCGGGSQSSSTSTTPTTPTPTPVNVAGLWTGTTQLTSATGGDCVGTLYAGQVGTTSTYAVQVTQSGSSITARATSTTTGQYTDYTGTAGSSSVSLNWTYATAGVMTGFRCSNGQLRDLRLQTSTITADIYGNSGTGTAAESWNVYINGTQTGAGSMILSSTFKMAR